MGALTLRYFIVRLRLHSVDNVWEFHCILDEEYWDVVTNDIPVALVGVEFDCKASHIADSICRAATALDSAESKEHWSVTRSIGQDAGARVLRQALVHLEGAESTGTPCVDHALWNPLMVKAMDL